jgi:hypothetical protein
MAVKTYSELRAQLADNTTKDISPSDVREIVDTFATRYIVNSYSSGTTINTTGGTWERAPITKYGTGSSPDMSNTSNIVNIGTPGLYMATYRILGNSTSSAVFRIKLRYDNLGSYDDLPFSTVSLEVSGNDLFTLSGSYLLNIPTANSKIDLAYQTVSNENWENPQMFLTIVSLPAKQT